MELSGTGGDEHRRIVAFIRERVEASSPYGPQASLHLPEYGVAMTWRNGSRDPRKGRWIASGPPGAFPARLGDGFRPGRHDDLSHRQVEPALL